MKRDEVARGGFIFFGKNITVAVLGLILTSLLARILSPEKFGIFSIATSLALFFMAVFNLGLGETAIKFISEFRAKGQHKKASRILKDVILIRLFFTSLISLSFFLLSDYLAGIYAIGGLSELLKLSALMIFSMSNAKLLWNALVGFREYGASSKAQVIEKSLSIVFFILFFALGDAEPGYAIISFIIASMCAGYYSLKRLSPFIMREKEKNMYRIIMYFAMPLYLINTLKELQWDFANVVLGFFDIPSNVGLLAFSLKISGTLLLMNKSFSTTFIPLFSHIQAQGRSLKDVYHRLSVYLLQFAILSSAILIFFTQEILWLFGGVEYLPAIPVVQFLALIPVISVFSNLNYRIFISHGKTKTLFYLSVLRLTLIISLLVTLTPQFLMAGASIALFLSSFIATSVSTVCVMRLLKGGIDYARITRSIVPLLFSIPALFIPELAFRFAFFVLFLISYANISLKKEDIGFFTSIQTGNRFLDSSLRLALSVLRRVRVVERQAV